MVKTEYKDRTLLFLHLVLLLFSYSTTAQVVSNDDFVNRLSLLAEIPVNSTTAGCTVQANCVDEKLTGKCVEYHNDQWFEFKPVKSGNYFVNISGQQCRDVRGVQLVVFTGLPCQPETYKIFSCTSLGSLDNVFVPLYEADAQQTYYLNVDGYLHDFCTFQLEISAEPKGLPATTIDQISAPTSLKSVTIHWQLPDSLLSQTFKIWRRQAEVSHSTLIKEITVIRNAYGRPLEIYQFTDTLSAAGTYFYQIVAEGAGVPVLIKQVAHQYKASPPPQYVLLPLNEYPSKAKLTIIATNLASGNILRRAEIINHKKQQSQACFLLSETEIETGKRIQVTILQHKKNGQVSRSFLVRVQEGFPE